MLKRMLDRPVAVTMTMLVVVVLGIVSIRLLPVSLIPDVDIPRITIQATSSRMSAREIDQSIIKTLVRQLKQLDGIEDIEGESNDGLGTVSLQFSHGTDMDYAFIEVNEIIDRCMPELPDVERPKVLKASASDIPAFYLNMTAYDESDEAFRQMSGFAEEIVCKRIEQLPEVAMVDISGTVNEQILILPDHKVLDQLGISLDKFEDIARSSNINLGSLSIRDGQFRYNVKFKSAVTTCEDISNIRFRSGDRILQIKDVAQVFLQPVKRTGLVHSDGKQALSLAIIKQSDAKMADLRKSMSSLLDDLSRDNPGVRFSMTRDQTKLLEYTINNLLQNIVVGILLASLIIFLFMRDLRSPLLVFLTMPVALIFSMAVFYATGLTINIISLSGLLLGVGMMADNAIILVDNITGKWQAGENLKDAVLHGTTEVSGPMLSSILTTCAVFIPLVFISGIAGEIFFDQALAITIILLTSYVVTLTMIPVYYFRWYQNSPSFQAYGSLTRIKFDEKMTSWSEKVTEWFLDHTRLAWCILAVTIAGSALCFLEMPKERLPEMTQTETIAHIDWNEQLSIEENERRTSLLEAMLSGESLQTTSLIGVQGFILDHSGRQNVGETSLYVCCKDKYSLKKAVEILQKGINDSYPSAILEFKAAENIFDAVFSDTEAPLIAKICGTSQQQLEPHELNELIGQIRSNVQDVKIDEIGIKTDILYVADQEKMALYGISYPDLASLLKNALNENCIFSITQGTRSVPVLIGTDAESLSEILDETFIDKGQVRIPVSEVLKQTYVEDFKTIYSEGEGIYHPVRFDIEQKQVKPVMKSIDEIVDSDPYHEVIYDGSWMSNRKMIRELIFILSIAIMLLYLILSSQFESLLQPLIILSEIAIDIFAALLVLWLMGMSINLMSMIGLVVVSGIVINDSILKVDTINRMRKEGFDLRTAITQASSRRMKAIIMTSLTTILSVCPFLSRGNMGDDLQYPMSIVIIVGMTVGTLVSLYLLPALYYSIYQRKER